MRAQSWIWSLGMAFVLVGCEIRVKPETDTGPSGGQANERPLAESLSVVTDEDTEAPIVLTGSDADADTLTYTVVADPTQGVLSGSPPDLIYTPNTDYSGADSFQFTVSDGTDESLPADVSITVNEVNDAPTADDLEVETTEETPVTIELSGTDVEDTDLTFVVDTKAAFGDLDASKLPSVVYTPGVDFNGLDSFTYVAQDSSGDVSEIATVSVTVTGINDAPVAGEDSYTMLEDAVLSVDADSGLLSNDTNVEEDTLSIASASDPVIDGDGDAGVLVVGDDGSFEYTPAANFNGTVTFSYRVTDGKTPSEVDTPVTIVVESVSDNPLVVGEPRYEVDEDNTLSVTILDDCASPLAGLLCAVTDPDIGDTVEVSMDGLDMPKRASGFTVNPDGTFEYVPNRDFNGEDSFQFRAVDSEGLFSDYITVVVDVVAQNDAPVSADDSYTVDEDEVLTIDVAEGLLNNDLDVDLDVLSVVTPSDPIVVSGTSDAAGTLSVSADGSFVYTPVADFNGTVSFTYSAEDTSGVTSEPSTVSIAVISKNDAPVASPDGAYDGREDTALDVTAADGLLANDTDVDGDDLSVAAVTAVTIAGTSDAAGALVVSEDGSFQFTPNPDVNGLVEFTYTITDGEESASALAQIALAPVNDAPVGASDAYTVREDPDAALAVPSGDGVLANDSDVDGDALSAVLVTSTASGALSLAADGSFTYLPNTHFFGTDSFTYVANDGDASSEPITVTLTVEAVNDGPEAKPDSYNGEEDAALEVAAPGVLVNDDDVDNSLADLSAELVDAPAFGSVVLDADGGFVYTPDSNANRLTMGGSDSFTYLVFDGELRSATATVSLTIEPVNDAPEGVADAYDAVEDTVFDAATEGVTVLTNDRDIDGDDLTASLASDVSHGTITFKADGTFIYTPEADYTGEDSFTYVVSDTSAATSEATTVTLNVLPRNDVPVSFADSYTVSEDNALTVSVDIGLLDNDSDVDGDTLQAVLSSSPEHGELSLNSNGSFVYTPDTHFNGTDRFTYRAFDGSLYSEDASSVEITVTPVNDGPTAVDDAFDALEDTTLNVDAVDGLLKNDSDLDGDTITVTDHSNATSGHLTVNADGSFEYIPEADFNGSDSFTYTVSDASGELDTATVSLTVASVNDDPVALPDSYSVNEDNTLSVSAFEGVLDNDSDVDGDSLSAAWTTYPTHGSLTLSSSGGFVYAPEDNFVGEDTFSYVASDVNGGNSSPVVVTITVKAVNDAPVAADDAYDAVEDTLLVVTTDEGVLSNDTDIDTASPLGDTLSAYVVSAPLHGSLTLGSDGSFTYQPDDNYNGTDTFEYAAEDRAGLISGGMVAIYIEAVNDAPVGASDAYEVDEDSILDVRFGGLLDNDSDVDGDDLSVALISDVSNGSMTLASDGTFTYQGDADFNGTDSFTYQAVDGTGSGALSSASQIVTITVRPVDDAPTGTDDSYTMNEDDVLTVGLSDGLLSNDTDVDGDTMAAILRTPPSKGSLALSTDGTFVYTPELNANGVDTFTYIVQANGEASSFLTVSIDVAPVNDAPVANADSYLTSEDTALIRDGSSGLRSNDSDVDNAREDLTVVKVTDPENGTVSISEDGAFVYTPNADFFGEDSFTYLINDGSLNSEVATVSVSVGADNDAPVGFEDNYDVVEDGSLIVSSADGVLANDEDADGDSLTASLIESTSNGTLGFTSSGGFTYRPNDNFDGTDTFSYQARDAFAASEVVTVSIAVTPVNDAPIAQNDSYDLAEDGELSVEAAEGVMKNDFDIESTPATDLTVNLILDASRGELTLNADGSFVYVPDANFFGVDAFMYTITDGAETSNSATVTLTVDGSNDAPVADNDTYYVDEDNVLTSGESVVANDTDADGDALTAEISSPPTNGTVIMTDDGHFTYTPDANYYGTDTFTYAVTDDVEVDYAMVSVVVGPINDAPVAATDLSAVMSEDTTYIAPGRGLTEFILDVDPDDTLTFDLPDGVEYEADLVGDLFLEEDGTMTYTPPKDFVGETNFWFTVSDGTVSTDGFFSFYVINVNDAPEVGDVTFEVTEDEALSRSADVGLLLNTTDVDSGICMDTSGGALDVDGASCSDYTEGDRCDLSTEYDDEDFTASEMCCACGGGSTDALTVTVEETELESGSLDLASDGSFVFTPSADWDEDATFVFTVSDGEASVSGTATLDFTAVNDAPVANDNAFDTDEDVALTCAVSGACLLTSVTDVDTSVDDLTVMVVTPPVHGTLVLEASGEFTYTPDADYIGEDTFVYRAFDGALYSNEATITVTMREINDAPVAKDDGYVAEEDTVYTVPAPGVLGNDEDVDGDPITVSSVDASDTVGTVEMDDDGGFVYTPAADFVGDDTFIYYATDSINPSIESATVTISVVGEADAPVTVEDHYDVVEDELASFDASEGVLANDSDVDEGTTLTIDLDAPFVGGFEPALGTVAFEADGSFTYTPNKDEDGDRDGSTYDDYFQYQVTDGDFTVSGEVYIYLQPVNDAPEADDDEYGVNEDDVLVVDGTDNPTLLDNDVDVEGDMMFAFEVDGPSHGLLEMAWADDGAFTYTPDADFTGTDTFTYQVVDCLDTNDGAADIEGFNCVDYADVAADATTADDSWCTYAADGRWDDEDFVVTDMCCACGGGDLTDGNVASVTINVNDQADAPSISDAGIEVDEDGSIGCVEAPCFDIEDADFGYTDRIEDYAFDLVSSAAHGTVELNADGTYTYTPDADFYGSDSFVVIGEGADELSDTATVNITVRAVDDLPRFEDGPTVTGGQQSATAEVRYQVGVGWTCNATVLEADDESALDFEYVWSLDTTGDGTADSELSRSDASVSMELTDSEISSGAGLYYRSATVSDVLEFGDLADMKRGDTVWCEVTALDWWESTTAKSEGIVVVNARPMLNDVYIEATTLTVADDMVCNAAASDFDGDTMTYTFVQSVDGMEITSATVTTADNEASATFGMAGFAHGDMVVCSVTVNDSEGETALEDLSDSVTVVNALPEVTARLESTTDRLDRVSTALCSAAGADADGEELEYAFTMRITGFAVTQDYSAADSFEVSLGVYDLVRGDSIECTATARDASEGVSDGDTVTAEIENALPVITDIDLTTVDGSAPVVDATLVCEATGLDYDEGDDVTLVYDWSITLGSFDNPDGDRVNTLDLSRIGVSLEKGDAVTCTVTPYDNYEPDVKGESASSTVTLQNATPSFEDVAVSVSGGGDANVTSLLDCAMTGIVDADGDTPSVAFTWTSSSSPAVLASSTESVSDGIARGRLDLSTFGSELVSKGDSVSCSAVVSDATSASTTAGTDSIDVLNSLPIATTVSVETGDRGDVVTCSVDDATDADGDDLSYQFEWLIDGTPVAGPTWYGRGIIAASLDLSDEPSAAEGLVLTCIVTPDDDGQLGITDDDDDHSIVGTSAEGGMVIANAAPTVYTSLTDSLAISASLTCSAEIADLDLEDLEVTLAWYLNDILVDGEGLTTTIEAATTSPTSGVVSASAVVGSDLGAGEGDTIRCLVTVTDGTIESSDGASGTVGDTPPTVDVDVTSDTDPATGASTFTCTGRLQDLDPVDVVDAQIEWTTTGGDAVTRDVEYSAATGGVEGTVTDTITAVELGAIRGDSVLCTLTADPSGLGVEDSDFLTLDNHIPVITSVELTEDDVDTPSSLSTFDFVCDVEVQEYDLDTVAVLIQLNVTPADGSDPFSFEYETTEIVRDTTDPTIGTTRVGFGGESYDSGELSLLDADGVPIDLDDFVASGRTLYRGDTLSCQAQAVEGTDVFGDVVESDSKDIENSPAEVEVALTVVDYESGILHDDATVECTAVIKDPDGDMGNLTVSIRDAWDEVFDELTDASFDTLHLLDDCGADGTTGCTVTASVSIVLDPEVWDAPHDRVICEVSFDDGAGSIVEASDERSIENDVPEIICSEYDDVEWALCIDYHPTWSLSDDVWGDSIAEASIDDSLKCMVVGHDDWADELMPETATFEFYVASDPDTILLTQEVTATEQFLGAVEAEAIVVPSLLGVTKGDELVCSAYLHDVEFDDAFSATYTKSILMNNSAPDVLDVSLTPAPTAGIEDTLACTAEVQDADMEDMCVRFQMEVSQPLLGETTTYDLGALDLGGDAAEMIVTQYASLASELYASKGDSVTCVVDVIDNACADISTDIVGVADTFGGTMSADRDSNVVTIEDTDPTVSVTVDNTTPTVGDTVTCTVTPYDPDGDALELVFALYSETDGVNIATETQNVTATSGVYDDATASFDLLEYFPGSLAKGDKLRCIVTVSDLYDSTASGVGQSDVIDIQDATPVLNAVTLQAYDAEDAATDTLTREGSLTCSADFVEFDNDATCVRFQLEVDGSVTEGVTWYYQYPSVDAAGGETTASYTLDLRDFSPSTWLFERGHVVTCSADVVQAACDAEGVYSTPGWSPSHPASDVVVAENIETIENSPPHVVDDLAAGDEDGGLITGSVLDNDSDRDNDIADGSYTLEQLSSPAGGMFDFDTATGVFNYTPDVDFNGDVSFEYRLNDGYGGSNEATVSIRVTAINDLPEWSSDVKHDWVYGSTLEMPDTEGLLAGVTDVDDTLSVRAETVTSALGVDVAINGDGSFVYYSQNRHAGDPTVDTFAYTVFEGERAAPIVTSDGSEEAPYCSWSSGCVWNDATKAECAAALCAAAGYEGGSFVSSAGDLCSGSEASGSQHYYNVSTDSYEYADYHSETAVTAECLGDESAIYARTGTVEFATTRNIWYVDNATLETGDGTERFPYPTLFKAEFAHNAGDIIYVKSGDGTSYGQDEGIQLRGGAWLAGPGMALDVSGIAVEAKSDIPAVLSSHKAAERTPVVSFGPNAFDESLTVTGLTLQDGPAGIGWNLDAFTSYSLADFERSNIWSSDYANNYAYYVESETKFEGDVSVDSVVIQNVGWGIVMPDHTGELKVSNSVLKGNLEALAFTEVFAPATLVDSGELLYLPDSNCDGVGAANDEMIADEAFVEVTNMSGRSIDLSDVSIENGSAVLHSFGRDAGSLAPGASVVVWDNCEGCEANFGETSVEQLLTGDAYWEFNSYTGSPASDQVDIFGYHIGGAGYALTAPSSDTELLWLSSLNVEPELYSWAGSGSPYCAPGDVTVVALDVYDPVLGDWRAPDTYGNSTETPIAAPGILVYEADTGFWDTPESASREMGFSEPIGVNGSMQVRYTVLSTDCQRIMIRATPSRHDSELRGTSSHAPHCLSEVPSDTLFVQANGADFSPGTELQLSLESADSQQLDFWVSYAESGDEACLIETGLPMRRSRVISSYVTQNDNYYDTPQSGACGSLGVDGLGYEGMSPGSTSLAGGGYSSGMYTVGLGSVRMSSEPAECRASLTIENTEFVDWASAMQVGAKADPSDDGSSYHSLYMDLVDSTIKNLDREVATRDPNQGESAVAALTVSTDPQFMQSIEIRGTDFANLFNPGVLINDFGSAPSNTQVTLTDVDFTNVSSDTWEFAGGYSDARGSVMWHAGYDSGRLYSVDETSSLVMDDVDIDASSDGVVTHTYGGSLDLAFENTESPYWAFQTMGFVADDVYYNVESSTSTLANGMAALGNSSAGSTPVVTGWELATNIAVDTIAPLVPYCGDTTLDCVCGGMFYEGQRVIRTSSSSSNDPGVGSLGTVIGGKRDAALPLLVSWDAPTSSIWTGHDYCDPTCGGDFCGETEPDSHWWVTCGTVEPDDSGTW